LRPRGRGRRVVPLRERADRGLRPRLPEGLDRRALAGDQGRSPRLDRPRRRTQRRRRFRLGEHGQERAIPAVGERILQPQRRSRVRPRWPIPGLAAGDTAHAATRRDVPRAGRSRRRPVRPRRPACPPRGPRRRGGHGNGDGPPQARRAASHRVPHRRPLSRRHVVGPARDVHAPSVPRRTPDGRRHERRDALPTGAVGLGGGKARDVPAVADANADRADATGSGRRVQGGVHRDPDGNPGGRAEGQHGHERARRPLHLVPLHAVRIAYDVTPLSHPRTGVGNYVLGPLQGMAEASAGEHELVAFGPVSIRGRPLLDEALDGTAASRRLVTVPFAHATRRAWSKLGRPPAERFVGGFDALHFTDWMYPPQRGGVRATMIHDLGPLKYPEKLHRRTVSMHTSNAEQARRCDLVFTNSEFTASDVVDTLGVPRERIRVAYPGVGGAFTPEGERHDAGRPYAFTTATPDWR